VWGARSHKVDCPTYLKKQQGGDKKKEKKPFNKRRAYIAFPTLMKMRPKEM